MDDTQILTEITQLRGKMMKRISPTRYKYVYIVSYNGVLTYRAELPKLHFAKTFAIARDAALAIDKKLLENNIDPVNILKRK
jgi:hypothetical protein